MEGKTKLQVYRQEKQKMQFERYLDDKDDVGRAAGEVQSGSARCRLAGGRP